jgi:hypothetical protein
MSFRSGEDHRHGGGEFHRPTPFPRSSRRRCGRSQTRPVAAYEGLAALFAYRLAQHGPITFTLAANDYGFELLSPDPPRLEEALEAGPVSPDHLLHDTPASLNAAELARSAVPGDCTGGRGVSFRGIRGTRA